MTNLKIQSEADTRNEALEEAATTCELLTTTGSSVEWGIGTMDCARAIRALKTAPVTQIVVRNCTVH
jgi:hypothetical protein